MNWLTIFLESWQFFDVVIKYAIQLIKHKQIEFKVVNLIYKAFLLSCAKRPQKYCSCQLMALFCCQVK